MPSNMKEFGFYDAGPGEKRRLIAAVMGLEKHGKTNFALTAPDPIAIFNRDIGTEGVIEKFIEAGKKIWVKDIMAEGPDEAEEEWESFRKIYLSLLSGDEVKTIVVDTETEMWELTRLARFGKLTQVMPYHYGPVNSEYRKLIRAAYSSDKNLILLQKMKPKYVNDKKTSEYERSGFSDLGFMVQTNLRVFRDPIYDGGEFNVEILDSRHNSEAAGEMLSGPMADFRFVVGTIFPSQDPDQWYG